MKNDKYYDLLKGPVSPAGSNVDKHELTFGDLLRECQGVAKERIDERLSKDSMAVRIIDMDVRDQRKFDLILHKYTDKVSIPHPTSLLDVIKKLSHREVQNLYDELRNLQSVESKQVSEQDYKEDNEELNKDVTPDLEDRSKDPDSGIPPAPEEVKKPGEPMEMRKEYLGRSEDVHYYFITIEGGEGAIEDFVIVDQEGVKKYSAKEQDIEITEENIAEFIIQAIRDVEIVQIERNIFLKYVYPKLEKESPEEEEIIEEPEEEEGEEKEKPLAPEEEEEFPRESVVHETKVEEQQLDLSKLGDDELVAKYGELQSKVDSGEVDSRIKIKLNTMAKLIKKRGLEIGEKKEEPEESETNHLYELKITDDAGNEFDVYLIDEDTEGAVVGINGREFRFSPEFSSLWRDEEGTLSEEGLKELSLDALANLEEEEYNELVTEAGEEEDVPESKKKANEQREQPTGFDVNGASITKGSQVMYDGGSGRVLAVWDDGTVEVSISGPGGEGSDTIDIKGQNVVKADKDVPESKKIKEGEDERGKRDGTGPAKGSAQRSISNKGRRKEAGEECPFEEDNKESKENNKGNDGMLDEKKTVIALLHAAEKAEQKAKDLRKEAAELKKTEKEAAKAAKEKEQAKAKKESVESEETGTEINETDVAKGAKALIKLAKDALKNNNWTELADHAVNLKAIEDVIPPEAEAEAEKAPEEAPAEDEPEVLEEPEAPAEDELEDESEEDVVSKEEELDVEESVEGKEGGFPEKVVIRAEGEKIGKLKSDLEDSGFEVDYMGADLAVQVNSKEQAKKIDRLLLKYEANVINIYTKEGVDEKKAPPVCKKCGKKHWPFQKCGVSKKAKKESKIEVEPTEDITERKSIERLQELLGM